MEQCYKPGCTNPPEISKSIAADISMTGTYSQTVMIAMVCRECEKQENRIHNKLM